MAKILMFPSEEHMGAEDPGSAASVRSPGSVIRRSSEQPDLMRSIEEKLFRGEDLSEVRTELLEEARKKPMYSVSADGEFCTMHVCPRRRADYRICIFIRPGTGGILTAFPYFSGLDFYLTVRDMQRLKDRVPGIVVSEIGSLPFLFINPFLYREYVLMRKDDESCFAVSAFAMDIDVRPEGSQAENRISITEDACLYRIYCRLQEKNTDIPLIRGSGVCQYTVTIPAADDICITLPVYIERGLDSELGLENGVIIEGTFCLMGSIEGV